MSDKQVNEGELSEEFRALGKNLADLIRSAWESPERKRLQHEMETGLRELGVTLKQEIDTFQESPTGQRLRTEVEDVQRNIRSGEAQAQARSELFTALKKVNEELEKAAAHLSGAGRGPGRADVDAEIHPDDVDNPPPPEARA